jgi:hypothetical protein
MRARMRNVRDAWRANACAARIGAGCARLLAFATMRAGDIDQHPPSSIREHPMEAAAP